MEILTKTIRKLIEKIPRPELCRKIQEKILDLQKGYVCKLEKRKEQCLVFTTFWSCEPARTKQVQVSF